MTLQTLRTTALQREGATSNLELSLADLAACRSKSVYLSSYVLGGELGSHGPSFGSIYGSVQQKRATERA